MPVVTVIDKAIELVESVGKEEAIKFFESRINEIKEPINFEQLCKISGWETAIDYIKGNISNMGG